MLFRLFYNIIMSIRKVELSFLAFIMSVGQFVGHSQRCQDVLITPENTDSIAVVLAEIYGLDQGIRSSSLYSLRKRKDVREYVVNIDSINFHRAYQLICQYGWVSSKRLGAKYRRLECIDAALPAIFLHNFRYLSDVSVRNTLSREVKKKNLSPKTYMLILDKYYVVCEKRTLLNSEFKQWLDFPYVKIKDKSESDSIMESIGQPLLPDSVFK